MQKDHSISRIDENSLFDLLLLLSGVYTCINPKQFKTYWRGFKEHVDIIMYKLLTAVWVAVIHSSVSYWQPQFLHFSVSVSSAAARFSSVNPSLSVTLSACLSVTTIKESNYYHCYSNLFYIYPHFCCCWFPSQTSVNIWFSVLIPVFYGTHVAPTKAQRYRRTDRRTAGWKDRQRIQWFLSGPMLLCWNHTKTKFTCTMY